MIGMPIVSGETRFIHSLHPLARLSHVVRSETARDTGRGCSWRTVCGGLFFEHGHYGASGTVVTSEPVLPLCETCARRTA